MINLKELSQLNLKHLETKVKFNKPEIIIF